MELNSTCQSSSVVVVSVLSYRTERSSDGDSMNRIDESEGASLFGEAAGDYDIIRPGYPKKFFDNLQESGALVPGANVLDVGAGNGLATKELMQRGAGRARRRSESPHSASSSLIVRRAPAPQRAGRAPRWAESRGDPRSGSVRCPLRS